MTSERTILLVAICFVCVRTEHVRRGAFLALAILLWGASLLLTELNFSRAQYDAAYTYGTAASYAANCALGACLFALFAACWKPQRDPRRRTADPRAETTAETEEANADPSERLRELLEDDR